MLYFRKAGSSRISIMTRPDQTRPDQTRPDRTGPDQTGPDQTGPDRRCFETEISVLDTFPRGKLLFPAISKRPTYLSCFNFWRMIKRQYVWRRISQHYTLLFHVLLNLYKHCTLWKGEVKKRVTPTTPPLPAATWPSVCPFAKPTSFGPIRIMGRFSQIVEHTVVYWKMQ